MISHMFFQIDPLAEFFLKIAHALHDKVKKLIYRSPVTGDVVILDHEGSCQLSAVSPEEVVPMTYKGIVKGNVIELEGEATLPEGTRVSIIPEQPVLVTVPQHPMTLYDWLQEARQVRAQLPKTSDSVEILRQLREERVSR